MVPCDKALEVIRRAEEYDRCWVEGRTGDLRQFLHPDVVFAGPDFQRLVRGADACLESYVKFVAAARIHDFRTADYQVDLAGHAAVMTYRWTIDYEFGDTRSVETGQDLLVWVETDGRWTIVWRSQRPGPAGGT